MSITAQVGKGANQKLWLESSCICVIGMSFIELLLFPPYAPSNTVFTAEESTVSLETKLHAIQSTKVKIDSSSAQNVM